VVEGLFLRACATSTELGCEFTDTWSQPDRPIGATCNHGLGHFKDRIDLLDAAKRYLSAF